MNEFPPPSWSSISFILQIIGISGSTIIVCLLWFTSKLEDLRRQSDAFRIEVANNYVNLDTLRGVETRMEYAIRDVGDRLNRSIEKLLDMLRSEAIERARHKHQIED